MRMQSIILLGGGGHAAVVAEAAKAAGYIVEGYLDDAEKGAHDDAGEVVGFRRLGPINGVKAAKEAHRHAVFHAAIGDPKLRKKWLGLVEPRPTPAIIHPSAVVSPSAKIGEGAFIGARAVVNTRASIGAGAIINTAAIIEHDCVIDAFCHIGPGSVLCGAVAVGEATLVGAGAVVIPGVRIGAGCTLGAGAVVIADVADGETVVGVPGRVVESREHV